MIERSRRLLLGNPVPERRQGEQLLPKSLALPTYAADALSSVAYAPDEILLTLAIAGPLLLGLSGWVALAVILVLLVVVISYRQVVKAYPQGGGAYAAATHNLGPVAGQTVASALLVDYILTVAVSTSAGSAYLAAAIPALKSHAVLVAVGLIVLLMLVNLRGVRESARLMALPVYLYMGAVGGMVISGVLQYFAGRLPQAASAGLEFAATDAEHAVTGLGAAFLVLRAFSSGAAALTGVEAIANGVPNFARPKARNAARTLSVLGAISVSMLAGVVWLANRTGVKYVEHPEALLAQGRPVGEEYHQLPVIGQLAEVVFANQWYARLGVTVLTGFILVLAAHTAFSGFPVLAARLGKDSLLPRQLKRVGDRLVYSNGVLLLALLAGILVVAFSASVTRLIQLYVVGVFTSFSLGQLAMVRHFNRVLSVSGDPRERRQASIARVVNIAGATCTTVVLLVVLITKFTHGAWLSVLFMVLAFVLMRWTWTSYRRADAELEIHDIEEERLLPPRVHAVVLVSRLNRPTMRAISYARSTRPSSITALHVGIETEAARQLHRTWQANKVAIPLTVLYSPFRDLVGPVERHIRTIRRASPRDLVVVYLPEFIVRNSAENVLHNHSAFLLRRALATTPDIVVASVPWQLGQEDDEPSTDAPSVVEADDSVPAAVAPAVGGVAAVPSAREPEPAPSPHLAPAAPGPQDTAAAVEPGLAVPAAQAEPQLGQVPALPAVAGQEPSAAPEGSAELPPPPAQTQFEEVPAPSADVAPDLPVRAVADLLAEEPSVQPATPTGLPEPDPVTDAEALVAQAAPMVADEPEASGEPGGAAPAASEVPVSSATALADGALPEETPEEETLPDVVAGPKETPQDAQLTAAATPALVERAKTPAPADEASAPVSPAAEPQATAVPSRTAAEPLPALEEPTESPQSPQGEEDVEAVERPRPDSELGS